MRRQVVSIMHKEALVTIIAFLLYHILELQAEMEE